MGMVFLIPGKCIIKEYVRISKETDIPLLLWETYIKEVMIIIWEGDNPIT